MLCSQESTMLQHFRRGSDPRAATCRGKLQTQRSKLNMQINKELMLRSGAENLFKAATNKKMKETVAIELSYLNSNLQLLKEQLAELNSSMEVYQMQSKEDTLMPMIPLGLKETKEIDMKETFRDFILEHYSEDGCHYDDQLSELMDLRQAMRTPTRDNNGISLLFEYYNQLYFVERRFFPPDRSLGIFFEWYDSLTGVPSSQRTVAFEKASVLFNIGGLFTQIGTKQDRTTQDGLDAAVDNFLRAAGTFQYIHENFTNAPSSDLGPETLHMLVQLMCGQARECLFEKTELTYHEEDETKNTMDLCLELGQEAGHVSEVYEKVQEAISQPPVKDYVPYTWVSLVQVKKEHYRALSNYYVAIALLDYRYDDLQQKTCETLQFIHDIRPEKAGSRTIRPPLPVTEDMRLALGKAHLKEALLEHEEALRVNRMCRELRKKDTLHDVLRTCHDRCLDKYADVDDEDDFSELVEPPPILPGTTFQLTLAYPDFSRHKVSDLFRSLGPVAVFSAKHHWSAPRTVQLRKKEEEGYGFSVRGDAPVIVAGVEHSSLADIGGMREGDYLVGIGDADVKWSSHGDVVKMIRDSENSLKLRLVTPLDRSLIKLQSSNLINSKPVKTVLSSSLSSPSSTTSSSSGLSMSACPVSSEETFSPASSESGGSSKDHHSYNKKSWPRIFNMKSRDRRLSRDDIFDDNFHFR